MKHVKILMVCSSGGHLLQLYSLSKQLCEGQNCVWVSFEKSDAQSLLKGEKIYWGHFPTNRNIPNLFRNALLAWKILRDERPACVVSTGAGIAVPFLLLAPFVGAKAIYIESFARKTNLSLTGKLVYRFVDHFFVQSEMLARKYNKAVFRGTIY